MKTTRRSLSARIAFTVIAVLASPTLAAHHSFAMYDKSITYVFTGVVERINPDGAHLQIVFVPLNEKRDALVRDAEGKPASWLVEMGGAGAMAREGITVDGFPRGTVFSVGLAPLRSGQRGGARVDGLFSVSQGQAASRLACTAIRSRAPRRTATASSRSRPQPGSRGRHRRAQSSFTRGHHEFCVRVRAAWRLWCSSSWRTDWRHRRNAAQGTHTKRVARASAAAGRYHVLSARTTVIRKTTSSAP